MKLNFVKHYFQHFHHLDDLFLFIHLYIFSGTRALHWDGMGLMGLGSRSHGIPFKKKELGCDGLKLLCDGMGLNFENYEWDGIGMESLFSHCCRALVDICITYTYIAIYNPSFDSYLRICNFANGQLQMANCHRVCVCRGSFPHSRFLGVNFYFPEM